MANAVATVARLPMPSEAIESGISPSKWRVLTEAIWPGAKSPEAIMLAVSYCKARGLDPLKRPVHIVAVWDSRLGREIESIWPGINEIQTTAHRTAQWAGMDPPKWGPERTEHFEGRTRKGEQLSATVTFPDWCEITVYRLVGGQKSAFTEVVYWLESYSGKKGTPVPNDMWSRRPRGMLLKCAKAAVLRSAFPEECGEYAAEEMEGKDIANVPDEGEGMIVEGQVEHLEHDPETGELHEPAPEPPVKPSTADFWSRESYTIPVNGGGWQRWQERVLRAIAAAPDLEKLQKLQRDNEADWNALRSQLPRAAAALDEKYEARAVLLKDMAGSLRVSQAWLSAVETGLELEAQNA